MCLFLLVFRDFIAACLFCFIVMYGLTEPFYFYFIILNAKMCVKSLTPGKNIWHSSESIRGTAVQRLELSPHSKKVLGLTLLTGAFFKKCLHVFSGNFSFLPPSTDIQVRLFALKCERESVTACQQ